MVQANRMREPSRYNGHFGVKFVHECQWQCLIHTLNIIYKLFSNELNEFCIMWYLLNCWYNFYLLLINNFWKNANIQYTFVQHMELMSRHGRYFTLNFMAISSSMIIFLNDSRHNFHKTNEEIIESFISLWIAANCNSRKFYFFTLKRKFVHLQSTNYLY